MGVAYSTHRSPSGRTHASTASDRAPLTRLSITVSHKAVAQVPTGKSGSRRRSSRSSSMVSCDDLMVGPPGLEPGTYGLKVRSSNH